MGRFMLNSVYIQTARERQSNDPNDLHAILNAKSWLESIIRVELINSRLFKLILG